MGTANDDIPVLLKRIQDSWEALAKDNAMWAILTPNHQWDVDNFFATGRDFIKTMMDYYKSLNINMRYGDCLDFGCGVGRLTQPLAEWFERIVGVDISSEMILQANKFNKYPAKVRYLQNTENLPFADATFDYVQTHIVLQHVDYALSMHYLEEFTRVLRPEGILYFQLPTSLGQSKGICHFENKIDTKSGQVSMDMNCIPYEIIMEKLTSLGARCLHTKIEACSDGMSSCMYIASK
jgi:SAM-dependent methyltransferase